MAGSSAFSSEGAEHGTDSSEANHAESDTGEGFAVVLLGLLGLAVGGVFLGWHGGGGINLVSERKQNGKRLLGTISRYLRSVLERLTSANVERAKKPIIYRMV